MYRYGRRTVSMSHVARQMQPDDRAGALASFLQYCTPKDVAHALEAIMQNPPSARRLGADLALGGAVEPDDDRWDWLWQRASCIDLQKLDDIREGRAGVPDRHRHAILDLAVQAGRLSVLRDIDFFAGLSANTKAVAKHILNFIKADDLAQLTEAEKCGLIHAKRIDEYIAHAGAHNKPTILAYLLEWKNQNVDVAEERRKAETRARRLLNANPNSVAELSKLWRYDKLDDDNVTTLRILKYKGKDTIVRIPETIGKAAVTTLGLSNYKYRYDGVFYNRTDMEQVTLPQGLRHIGANVFYGCTRLRDIALPEGLQSIGDIAFGGCKALSEITFPASLQSIDRCAFERCSCLKSAVFASGEVRMDGRSAWENPFRDCNNLTVYAPHGSAVHEFATKMNIPFAPLEDA